MPFIVNSTYQGTWIPIIGPLTYLDLSSNKFVQFLSNITGHKTLQYLNVSNNWLNGSLDPTGLTNVPTLTTMDLSNNLFTGPIPNVSSLGNLQYLDLSYNNFTPGPFPSWTTELNNIVTLLLRGVSLTGDIPSSVLVGFKSLITLSLDDNSLTGTLDFDSMFAVPNRSRRLQLVSLRNNQIRHVAYSGHVVNLTVKFFLQGNPYCDNSTSANNDLSRCVCQQQCSDTRK
jgi:Leucine-rich repeat (LRR) protein